MYIIKYIINNLFKVLHTLKMLICSPISRNISPKKMGRAGKRPGIGPSRDQKRYPEIVGVIN